MPKVFITCPPNDKLLDYTKKVTIEWDSDPQGSVKSWKFYLGSEDGRWDILMCELGALNHIDLDPEILPHGGKLFGQVRGVYDGEDRDHVAMDERVVSDIFYWRCPD